MRPPPPKKMKFKQEFIEANTLYAKIDVDRYRRPISDV